MSLNSLEVKNVAKTILFYFILFAFKFFYYLCFLFVEYFLDKPAMVTRY